NYVVLQSIPCSPECKIVGQILLDHPLIYALTATADVPVVYLQQFWRTVSKVPNTKDTIKFLLDTQQFTYTVDMFRDTLHLPVETPATPFVAPANIHTIEAFMNRVGYQGVVDKVSAFFAKNLAQPWQTMFKFHAVVNRTNVDYAALLWWDFINNVFQKKEAIQYPHFIKLIIADLIKKFPNIPKRLKEDYHSIKDDVPLVSVYTTGNVLVLGMLIPDALLTAEIRETNDFKEYETVRLPFLLVLRRRRKGSKLQENPVHQESHSRLQLNKKEIIDAEKDGVDSEDRLEPGSHKENPKVIDDDDDNARETKDDTMGSLEFRNEEMQTTISTPIRSPKKSLSSDKKFFQELTDTVFIPRTTTSKHAHVKKRISSKYSHLSGALHRMCKRQGYMIQDMERKCVTTEKFWETHNKVDHVPKEVIPEIAENVVNDLIEYNLKPCIAETIIKDRDAFRSDIPAFMNSSLRDRANNITLWEALRRKFEKTSTSNTSCREDGFHSHHDEYQDDDAPPEGEKRVKRSKKSKRSKSARGSSSKHSKKTPQHMYPNNKVNINNGMHGKKKMLLMKMK
ncbi:hypothetical protein Tco_1460180, partial [Tanacetum coccineum]